MFTGLIEEIGTIRTVQRRSSSIRIEIHSHIIPEDLKVDHSVAVNGVCLTAVAVSADGFTVDAVAETLSRTTLRECQVGTKVNLERAMRLGDRLGGHLVQGHVDAIAPIRRFQQGPEGGILTIELASQLTKYVIEKGSITIDGISLTVAEKRGQMISLALIPHTLTHTILQFKKAGDNVNIEVDIIAKYIEQLFPGESRTGITREWLSEKGF